MTLKSVWEISLLGEVSFSTALDRDFCKAYGLWATQCIARRALRGDWPEASVACVYLSSRRLMDVDLRRHHHFASGREWPWEFQNLPLPSLSPSRNLAIVCLCAGVSWISDGVCLTKCFFGGASGTRSFETSIAKDMHIHNAFNGSFSVSRLSKLSL